MALGPFTQLDQLYAAVRVATDGTSNGTTDTDSYREGRATATARSATGVYSVTLDPGIDAAECKVRARLVGAAANSNVQVSQTNDTTFAVTAFVGTVATDIGFELDVTKVRSAP